MIAHTTTQDPMATALKSAPLATPDPRDDAMAAAKPTAPASKKSTTPAVNLDFAGKDKRFAEVLAMLKDLEAEKNLLAADMLPKAEVARVELSRKANKFLSTLDLNGRLRYSTQRDWYTKIPSERYGDLQRLFGAAHAMYFQPVFVVEGGSIPPALVSQLAAAGLSVTWHLVPTDAYNTDRVMRPEIAALAAQVTESKPKMFFQLAK